MRKSILYTLISATVMAFAAVLVLAAPAARVGDYHTCPQITGLVPHVGGPIITGSPTVNICSLPAATVSSVATCTGPPDQIVTGSATVLINGLPAARQGDISAHGGLIIQGCGTVLIGP